MGRQFRQNLPGNICPPEANRNQSLTMRPLARTVPGIVHGNGVLSRMTDIAETEEAALDEDGASPKKSRRLLFILIAGGVAILLAGGAAAVLFVFSTPTAEDSAPAVEVRETFFFELPEMTVNLSTAPGEDQEFLKLSVSLELSDEKMADIISPRMPRVLDAFQVYLRELRRGDLEGSAGIFRLKEELRRRVNLAIYPAEVDSILFKEILVQ
jgi:flagellar FliL protein